MNKTNNPDPFYNVDFFHNGLPSHPRQNVPKYYPLYVPHTEWTSLYIPHLDSSYTQSHLAKIIEHKYSIGKVQSIDLIKNTSRNETNKDDYSAFIHFEYWLNSDFAIFLRNHLNKYEKYDISNYTRMFHPFSQDPDLGRSMSSGDHFHILINKSSQRHRGGEVPSEKQKNINIYTEYYYPV